MIEIEKRPYVQIAKNPVKDFFKRLYLSDIKPFTLTIVTPIMGSFSGTQYSLLRLLRKIEEEKFFTYIITRKPESEFHLDAINTFINSDLVEIRYNNSLHAKVYLCLGKDTGFALLGSGNLTPTSLKRNIEIGMLIFSHDRGKMILNELDSWVNIRLRTLPESKIAKKITYKRRV